MIGVMVCGTKSTNLNTKTTCRVKYSKIPNNSEYNKDILPFSKARYDTTWKQL